MYILMVQTVSVQSVIQSCIVGDRKCIIQCNSMHCDTEQAMLSMLRHTLYVCMYTY